MTTPIDIPAERTNRPYVIGLIAGLAASAILGLAFFAQCPPFTHDFCTNAAVAPLVWLASVMLALVAIFAFTFPGGLRFALSFCVTVLLCGVATGGILLKLWSLPVGAAVDATRPVWKPVAEAHERLDKKADWVAAVSAQTLEGVLGVRMIGELQRCADDFHAADSVQSYPRSAGDVTSSTVCSYLSSNRIDLPDDGTRYALGTDHGYRWSYVPGAVNDVGAVGHYTIRVEPDSLLRKPGPVYVSHEDGVVIEFLNAGTHGKVAANPVAFLKDIRPCIAQLPAERKRRASRTNYSYSEPTPFQAAASACPDVATRLRRDGDDATATVAFPIHDHPGEFLDTAVVYSIRYVPLDAEGVQFELYATPTTALRVHGGLRRYLIAGDGSVHVTRERRDATVEDPAPLACELDPGTPCAR